MGSDVTSDPCLAPPSETIHTYITYGAQHARSGEWILAVGRKEKAGENWECVVVDAVIVVVVDIDFTPLRLKPENETTYFKSPSRWKIMYPISLVKKLFGDPS